MVTPFSKKEKDILSLLLTKMDKISAELLDRIKTAVIKKLREMDRYVDNELSDYIMILVANKRTLAHMQKDLSLFLGKHTVDFTKWLFDMVARVKQNTSSLLKGEIPVEGVAKSNSFEEDADVLDCDLGDQEVDVLGQDDTSQSSQKTKEPETKEPLAKTSAPISKSRPVQHIKQSSSKMKSEEKSKLTTKSSFQGEVLKLSEAVVPESCVFDEYDPTRPEFTSGVSSVVHSIKKSHSKASVLQTNKLLMRAVNDATKSIADYKNLHKYKPTPINVLASARTENQRSRRQNLVDVKIDPMLNFEAKPTPDLPEDSGFYVDKIGSENHDVVLDGKGRYRSICMPPEQSENILYEHSALDDSSFDMHYSDVGIEQDEPTPPHFIVTLEGVDMPSLKRKIYDSEESMDAEDSYIANDDSEPIGKKQKIEKCKYFPSCKNEGCMYYHPTVPCNTFPDCTYGDSCLYVHPKCKFDSWCSKKGCPYTHTNKKSFSRPILPHKRMAKVGGFKAVCKFYPKCTVKNCAFIHPKLCRFGTKCRLATCQFTHVSIPSRDQLKWKASEDM